MIIKTLVGGLDGTDVKSDWQWSDQTDFAPRGLMIGNTREDASEIFQRLSN